MQQHILAESLLTHITVSLKSDGSVKAKCKITVRKDKTLSPIFAGR